MVSILKSLKKKKTKSIAVQEKLFLDEDAYATQASPFLKWAGGKKQLIKILLGLVPNKYNRYFEPFLGGGAMYFALHPKNAYLSDINPELINTYVAVRDEYEKLCADLKKHKGDEDYYYKIREADRFPGFNRWKPISKASRFIYLNHTCYNGIYRVNSMGQFNVPYGHYKMCKWLETEKLKECSNALKKAKLVCESYEIILDKVREDDFVFIDPPYAPIKSRSRSLVVNPNIWGEEEHIQLRDFCIELYKRGVKWLQTNSASPLIFELYKDFKILKVEANKTLNFKTNQKKSITELVIMNYKI